MRQYFSPMTDYAALLGKNHESGRRCIPIHEVIIKICSVWLHRHQPEPAVKRDSGRVLQSTNPQCRCVQSSLIVLPGILYNVRAFDLETKFSEVRSMMPGKEFSISNDISRALIKWTGIKLCPRTVFVLVNDPVGS